MDPSFEPGDDAGVLMALAEHDRVALSALCERHARPLYNLALAIGHDAPMAESTVLEALLAVWRAPDVVELDGRSLRYVLAEDVYRRCIDSPSRRQRRQRSRRSVVAREDVAFRGRSHELLALIILGDHDRSEAARCVGLRVAGATRVISDAVHACDVVGEGSAGEPADPLGTGAADASETRFGGSRR